MLPVGVKMVVLAKHYDSFLRKVMPNATEEVRTKILKSLEKYPEKAVFKRTSEGGAVASLKPTEVNLKDAISYSPRKKVTISEEAEIDLTPEYTAKETKREKVKRFLLKMILERKAKKKTPAIPIGKANAISVSGEQLHKMLRADSMVSERSKSMISHKYPVGDEYKVYKTAKSVMVEKLPDAWEREMNRLEGKLKSDLVAHLNENPDIMKKWETLLKGTK